MYSAVLPLLSAVSTASAEELSAKGTDFESSRIGHGCLVIYFGSGLRDGQGMSREQFRGRQRFDRFVSLLFQFIN